MSRLLCFRTSASSCISASPATPAWCSRTRPAPGIEETALGTMIRRYGLPLTGGMMALTAFWLFILVALPYFLMFEFSLRPYLTVDKIGGPEDVYTLKNYVTLFSNTIHFGVFLRTILAQRLRHTALSRPVLSDGILSCQDRATQECRHPVPAFLIPFWVNEILRSFAWFIILSYQGPLNALLAGVV